MGDITSSTDTEYEWMMRLGNCIFQYANIGWELNQGENTQ